MRPLQANTFTDVLASVAAQWSPSNDDAGPISWETSGVGPRTEGSGSAHGGSYFHVQPLPYFLVLPASSAAAMHFILQTIPCPYLSGLTKGMPRLANVSFHAPTAFWDADCKDPLSSSLGGYLLHSAWWVLILVHCAGHKAELWGLPSNGRRGLPFASFGLATGLAAVYTQQQLRQYVGHWRGHEWQVSCCSLYTITFVSALLLV